MQDNPYGLAALWSQGDLVIKCVALLLLAMSIASWYVIATRAWRLLKLRRGARHE
jgi:biopolymer transport protein ExbB